MTNTTPESMLALAGELIKVGGPARRAGVNRAYYAAFHGLQCLVRQEIGASDIGPNGTASHGAVLRVLRNHRRPCRHVARHHAARTDDRVVAHGHARQHDRARADPRVATDAYRPAELQPGRALAGIAGMVRGEQLHARTDLRAVADVHFDDVEDAAIEIQEDALAEPDVVASVAMEWRADDGAFADMREALRRLFAENALVVDFRTLVALDRVKTGMAIVLP